MNALKKNNTLTRFTRIVHYLEITGASAPLLINILHGVRGIKVHLEFNKLMLFKVNVI